MKSHCAVCLLLLVTVAAACGGEVASNNRKAEADRSSPIVPPSPDDSGAAPAPNATPGASAPDAAVAVAPCAPGDVSAFVPHWQPPAPLHQGRCTSAQIDMLVRCKLGDDPQACQNVSADATYADCKACLFTPITAAQLGPFIVDGRVIDTNFAGCVARSLDDVTVNGCGAKQQASDQCVDAACDPTCPLDGATALKDLQRCIFNARETVCATYNDDANCAIEAVGPGGPAAPCIEGQTFIQQATAIGTVFCGE